MSIHFADYPLASFPDNIEDIKERYEETSEEKDRHKFFTKDELKWLLKLCDLAESQASRQMEAATDYGIYGFEIVSDDRKCIEAMLDAKSFSVIDIDGRLRLKKHKYTED